MESSLLLRQKFCHGLSGGLPKLDTDPVEPRAWDEYLIRQTREIARSIEGYHVTCEDISRFVMWRSRGMELARYTCASNRIWRFYPALARSAAGVFGLRLAKYEMDDRLTSQHERDGLAAAAIAIWNFEAVLALDRDDKWAARNISLLLAWTRVLDQQTATTENLWSEIDALVTWHDKALQTMTPIEAAKRCHLFSQCPHGQISVFGSERFFRIKIEDLAIWLLRELRRILRGPSE